MAKSGMKVVVIDADLRLPSQHVLFNIDNQIGLSSILKESAHFPQAIRATKYDGVHVIPSGPLPSNPSELLGLENMKKIIEQISKVFDIAIIDAPSAVAVTDASVLAPIVDAAVLVVSRGKSNSHAVQSVITQFNQIKIRWIGVIVNRAELKDSHYYYKKSKEKKPGTT